MDSLNGEPAVKRRKPTKKSHHIQSAADEVDQCASEGPDYFQVVKTEPGMELRQDIKVERTDEEPVSDVPAQCASTTVKIEPGREDERSIDIDSTDGEPAVKRRKRTKDSSDVQPDPNLPDQCEVAPGAPYDFELVTVEPGIGTVVEGTEREPVPEVRDPCELPSEEPEDFKWPVKIEPGYEEDQNTGGIADVHPGSSAVGKQESSLEEPSDYESPVKIEAGWEGVQGLNVDATERECLPDAPDQSGFASNKLSGSAWGVKSFAYEQCNYRAESACQLPKHERTHTVKKLYACDRCDYSASKSSRLKRHLMTHTGEKPFACDQCDYRTAESSKLKRHSLTHTGERPFACDQCDYRATFADHLKSHMRTHTGERPFACHLCDHKSIQAGHLKLHVRTHSGEKPFGCDQRDYRSTRSDQLRSHVRNHSGE